MLSGVKFSCSTGEGVNDKPLSWQDDPVLPLLRSLLIPQACPSPEPEPEPNPNLILARKEESFSDWKIVVQIAEGDGADATTHRAHLATGRFTQTSISTQRPPGESTPYNVHRAILAPKAAYFKKIFRSGFSESAANQSELKFDRDVAEVFPTFLDFLYSHGNKLKTTTDNAVTLLHLSNYLGCETCFKTVVEFVQKDMSVQNACDYFRQARTYGLADLEEACLRLMASKFAPSQVVVQTDFFPDDQWLSLSPDIAVRLLNEVAKQGNTRSSKLISGRVSAWLRNNKSLVDQALLMKMTRYEICPIISCVEALYLLRVALEFDKEEGVGSEDGSSSPTSPKKRAAACAGGGDTKKQKASSTGSKSPAGRGKEKASSSSSNSDSSGASSSSSSTPDSMVIDVDAASTEVTITGNDMDAPLQAAMAASLKDQQAVGSSGLPLSLRERCIHSLGDGYNEVFVANNGAMAGTGVGELTSSGGDEDGGGDGGEGAEGVEVGVAQQEVVVVPDGNVDSSPLSGVPRDLPLDVIMAIFERALKVCACGSSVITRTCVHVYYTRIRPLRQRTNK